MSINSVILMGRLTADPELRTTQSGISVCSFTVAVDRYSKDKESKADFIRCVAWRQSAEFISRYFSKGKMIAIEGSIQVDNYTDKDGNKRQQTNVIVNKANFCGDKSSGSASQPGGSLDDFEEIISDGEPPF